MQLNPAGKILDMGKGRLAHHPAGDQAPGQCHRLGARFGAFLLFDLCEESERFCGGMRPVEATQIRLGALRAEPLQLLPALLLLLSPLGLHCAQVYRTSSGLTVIVRSGRSGLSCARRRPVIASITRRLPPMLPMIPWPL